MLHKLTSLYPLYSNGRSELFSSLRFGTEDAGRMKHPQVHSTNITPGVPW